MKWTRTLATAAVLLAASSVVQAQFLTGVSLNDVFGQTIPGTIPANEPVVFQFGIWHDTPGEIVGVEAGLQVYGQDATGVFDSTMTWQPCGGLITNH